MNSRSTWTLLIIAAGLFAFIFLVERPFRQERSKPPVTHLLPSLDLKTVSSIRVQPFGQLEIHAERTNGNWQLTEPVSYPADATRINMLLEKLSQLQWQIHIPAEELKDRPNMQREFGFENPRISLTVQQGSASFRLLVGTNAAVGSQIFLQIVGGNGVYVCDSEWLGIVPRVPEHWRNTLLVQPFADLGFLQVRSSGKSFELQKTNQIWRLTKPLGSRANNAKITNALEKLQAVRILQFVTDDPAADLQKYGLQTPDLEFSFSSDTNVLSGLQIGSSLTNYPAYVYARQLNRPSVYIVAKEAFEAWRIPYTDYRDRYLVGLTNGETGSVEVTGMDNFILRQQTNGMWLTEPQQFTADPGLVEELLVRLSHTEVELEKGVVTDFAAYGLSKPTLSYTLKSPPQNGGAKTIVQLDFGTNQAGQVFVRRADEDSVSVMKAEDFLPLPQVSWQMQDRRIWNFDSTNVLSVTIEQNGQTRRIVRNKTGDWIIAPGFEGYVNTFSFDEAVYRLGQLKAAYWVAENEPDRSKYGFTEANHKVTLDVLTNGKIEPLTLELGGLSEFKHPYAAVVANGHRRIFELPWTFYFDFVQKDLSIAPANVSK